MLEHGHWRPDAQWGVREGNTQARWGMARQDVFIPFNLTKLALLLECSGCGPGQILQSRMEATVALAMEGPSCFWDTPHHVYTFCLLWTERLASDDSSSVQHPCWGHTGGWASPRNPFGALKGTWVFLPPARMDAGCPLWHFPGWESAEVLSGQCCSILTVGKRKTPAGQWHRTLASR